MPALVVARAFQRPLEPAALVGIGAFTTIRPLTTRGQTRLGLSRSVQPVFRAFALVCMKHLPVSATSAVSPPLAYPPVWTGKADRDRSPWPFSTRIPPRGAVVTASTPAVLGTSFAWAFGGSAGARNASRFSIGRSRYAVRRAVRGLARLHAVCRQQAPPDLSLIPRRPPFQQASCRLLSTHI